jgi:hypothetical protein
VPVPYAAATLLLGNHRSVAGRSVASGTLTPRTLLRAESSLFTREIVISVLLNSALHSTGCLSPRATLLGTSWSP